MNGEYDFSMFNILFGFLIVSLFILVIVILVNGAKIIFIDNPAEIKACDSLCVSEGGFSTGIRTMGKNNEIPLCDCAIHDTIVTYRNVDEKFYIVG